MKSFKNDGGLDMGGIFKMKKHQINKNAENLDEQI